MIGRIGLDTTFVIDFLQGDPAAVQFMEKHRQSFAFSEIVVFETLCGRLTAKQEEQFLVFADSFPNSPLTRGATRVAASIFRQGKKLGKSVDARDALIAGSYVSEGVTQIVTRNKQHFENIEEVTVLPY